VAFTRDPATGERRLVGEYLANAQGEDVVAGIRTPLPLDGMARTRGSPARSATCGPSRRASRRTSPTRRTWSSRSSGGGSGCSRPGRPSGPATRPSGSRRDGREGLIDAPTAVRRVQPDHLDQLLHPTIDPAAEPEVLTVGLPASPGAASGLAVFDPAEARQLHADGRPVILVRRETSRRISRAWSPPAAS
jgi:pyruvate,orthophosphate dikinase